MKGRTMEKSKSKSESKSPTSVLDPEALDSGAADVPVAAAETLQEYLARHGYHEKGKEVALAQEVKEAEDAKDEYGPEEIKKLEEDLLYMSQLESRAAVKFDIMVFYRETIYHTFYPLSAPLMFWLDGGWLALQNRSFILHKTLQWTQLFWAINFYLLNVTGFLYIYRADNYDYLYDLVLVDLLWMIRNLVVATKYAFLSKIEMEEMRTKIVPPYVHTYRTLLTAWKDPIPSRVMKHELLLAAIRHKLMWKKKAFQLDMNAPDSTQAVRDLILDLRLQKRDFNSLSFSYGQRAHQWLQLGCESVSSKKDQQNWKELGGVENVDHLPARLYAAHVIRQGSSLSRLRRVGHRLLSQHLGKCAIILGLAHSVLPTVLRFTLGGHQIPGPPWVTYCFLIPAFNLVTFTMLSNVAFMMIGVLDFRRRHYFAESLDEVLRTGIYTGTHHVRQSSLRNRQRRSKPKSKWFPFRIGWSASTDEELSSRRSSSRDSSTSSNGSGKLSGEGIFINFSSVDSLLAWWTCRQLLTNFGYGFYKRIKYYTTYFAGYCAVLLIFLVTKMLTGIKREDFYLLATVAFSIYVFLTMLALMVWPGGDTNVMLQQHGMTLIKKKVHQQMTRYKEGKHLLDEPEATRKRASSDTINSISEAVKWDNDKTKLSICGFEARDQLVSLIVAAVTASISIGIGQIVQNGVKV